MVFLCLIILCDYRVPYMKYFEHKFKFKSSGRCKAYETPNFSALLNVNLILPSGQSGSLSTGYTLIWGL